MSAPASPAPSAAAPPAAPRVPFVIGITGIPNPRGYDDDAAGCASAPEMIALRAQLRDILDWVTGLGGAAKGCCLDPETGLLRGDNTCLPDTKTAYHSCWRPLDLAKSGTPVLILSSLGPGADTLMVEAAAAYHLAHPEAGIRVDCPLPFPLSHLGSADKYDTPARKQRLAETLDLIRRTWPEEGGGAGASRLFEVRLDNDLRGKAGADLTALEPGFDQPRHLLRDRAAGEYVAAHSDLLLAVYDVTEKGDLADLFAAGTATIVEAKRTGLTHELLAVSNNLAWADNGPVLVLPVFPKEKPGSPAPPAFPPPAPGPLRILHPYDSRPAKAATGLPDDDAEWQRGGDALFRRILARQKEFNTLPAIPKENGELESLAGAELLADPRTGGFARQFDALARVRRRAADEAVALGEKRVVLLKKMLGLIFVSALCFGAFEHWHNQRAAHHDGSGAPSWLPHDPHSLIQTALLLVSLGCLFRSGVLYFRHQKTDAENHRFDYRALGEALRVQFYWLLSGTGRGVSADYMQRQRDELDWIRYVVASLAIPIEESHRGFKKLDHEARHRVLKTVHDRWIRKQKEYFDSNAPKREKSAHLWHGRGWTLAASGLLSILLMLVTTASPRLARLLHHHYPLIAILGLVPGIIMLWAGRRKEKKHDASPAPDITRQGFLRWLASNHGTWGAALVIHSTVILAAFFLGGLCTVLPDEHNLWTILNGVVLLSGALCVAWAERNFFSEEARMFLSMRNLYACADRRLAVLLDRYKECADTDPQTPRLLFEIRDIYFQIGCEALSENAEWLIQHRSRPLEPFMAG